MEYINKIEEIIKNINSTLIDFSTKRERNSAPTQVSSEFLTNKEQGDWAEQTFIQGINKYSSKYIAVKYGRDDDIIAGEDGFSEFYEEYQNELDIIGKRPDVLIFDKNDFPFDTLNISHFDLEILDELVPKAKCGIEIRSSAFLNEKYNLFMEQRTTKALENIFKIKETIILKFSDLLKKKDSELFKIISQVDKDNVHVISYRTPTWRSSEELSELSYLLKMLKQNLNEIQKRTFLSITPKVEDLKVVYNWVKRYNVPHYYVQVFFDKAYGLSYEDILTFISDESLEDKIYFIESDVKNQNKTTIKIKSEIGSNILTKVALPNHESKMKELGRGRLLFYVTFKNSEVVINKEEFKNLFGFNI